MNKSNRFIRILPDEPKLNLVILFIYALISALFVLKYASRITPHAWIFAILYGFIAPAIACNLPNLIPASFRRIPSIRTYIVFVIFLSVFFIVVMLQFDPQTIRVTRYSALNEWITLLLQGQYPYGASSDPSGFPFLFILALPFYFLGDTGYLQIIGFILFCVLVYYRYSDDWKNMVRSTLLLIACPLFWYELVVRSELLFNMVIIIAFLTFLELRLMKKRQRGLFWIGIVGGLLLSTRGIVLLPYVAVMVWIVRMGMLQKKSFPIAIFIGFGLTLLPFLAWDWGTFMQSGPFSIQTAYLPVWIIIIAVIVCFVIGWKAYNLRQVYAFTGIVLFGVALASLVFIVTIFSWQDAIFRDAFDVGYFAFSLPFILLSFRSKTS